MNLQNTEEIALKRFMYKHDTGRMLKMTHQRYDQTGLEQWKHNEEWNKICPVCIAKEEVSLKLKTLSN